MFLVLVGGSYGIVLLQPSWKVIMKHTRLIVFKNDEFYLIFIALGTINFYETP